MNQSKDPKKDYIKAKHFFIWPLGHILWACGSWTPFIHLYFTLNKQHLCIHITNFKLFVCHSGAEHWSLSPSVLLRVAVRGSVSVSESVQGEWRYLSSLCGSEDKITEVNAGRGWGV